MTLQYLAGNIIVGLSTDTKPTSHVLDNTIFYETNTFKLYQWNGSTNAWIQEELVLERWTNKTLDADQNTFINCLVTPFSQTNKRIGIMTPAVTSYGSLYGALGGLTTQTTAGYGIAYADDQEGSVIRYQQSSGNRMGLASTSGHAVITRRAYNPRLKVRAKLSDISGRLYIGFASATELPLTNTVLSNEDSGFIVGFSTVTPNFTIFHNDGTGAMISTPIDAMTKDTDWHTYEIVMSVTNIVATIDENEASSITLFDGEGIPALDTDLNIFLEAEV